VDGFSSGGGAGKTKRPSRTEDTVRGLGGQGIKMLTLDTEMQITACI
jgi:hypothetical protein